MNFIAISNLDCCTLRSGALLALMVRLVLLYQNKRTIILSVDTGTSLTEACASAETFADVVCRNCGEGTSYGGHSPQFHQLFYICSKT